MCSVLDLDEAGAGPDAAAPADRAEDAGRSPCSTDGKVRVHIDRRRVFPADCEDWTALKPAATDTERSSATSRGAHKATAPDAVPSFASSSTPASRPQDATPRGLSTRSTPRSSARRHGGGGDGPRSPRAKERLGVAPGLAQKCRRRRRALRKDRSRPAEAIYGRLLRTTARCPREPQHRPGPSPGPGQCSHRDRAARRGSAQPILLSVAAAAHALFAETQNTR